MYITKDQLNDLIRVENKLDPIKKFKGEESRQARLTN